jgi:D-methionine transport system substrate-binding protein
LAIIARGVARINDLFFYSGGTFMKSLKKMSLKLITIIGVLALLTMLAACQPKAQDGNIIRVGTISGPETDLMVVAKAVAKKQFGLEVKIVEFNDYTMPNTALNDGSLDANVFQHQPYLDAESKNKGYQFVAVGKTFIYPVGIYSSKIKKLSTLPDKAIVAIPNDPSNEARALLLLSKAGLITLKPNAGVNATPVDIVSNPKNLQFKELDAAQLPRVLPDVTIAAINTNYAVPAGLYPNRDALFIEDKTSPYANLVVVRAADKESKNAAELVSALHSPEVLQKAKELFKGQALPAW